MVQKPLSRTIPEASKCNAQRFWDGHFKPVSCLSRSFKVSIPWNPMGATHLHPSPRSPFFFLVQQRYRDRGTEPAEHLFQCNGFKMFQDVRHLSSTVYNVYTNDSNDHSLNAISCQQFNRPSASFFSSQILWIISSRAMRKSEAWNRLETVELVELSQP